jgi:hypothetical protein
VLQKEKVTVLYSKCVGVDKLLLLISRLKEEKKLQENSFWMVMSAISQLHAKEMDSELVSETALEKFFQLDQTLTFMMSLQSENLI